MAIDIEFLLARHPFLFLGWKCSVEGFHGGGVLAAIGGGTGNVHPLSAVKCAGNKLTDKKRRGEVAVHHKADILLFAADKATADVVARIAKVDVHIITHFASNRKGMLDQHFAELLSLVFGGNTQRPEGENFLAFSILVLEPCLRVHNVADDQGSPQEAFRRHG